MSNSSNALEEDLMMETFRNVLLMIMALCLTVAALVYIMVKCCSCYYVYKKKGNKTRKEIGIGFREDSSAMFNVPSPNTSSSSSATPPRESNDMEKQLIEG